MQDHTILCRNCNTRVAKTPNQVCVKCKATKWGYTDAELSGAAPARPQVTPQQNQQQRPAGNPYGGQQQAAGGYSVTKLICKNCKTLVARTPDKKCSNCGRYNWGYSDSQLARMDNAARGGGAGAGLPRKTMMLIIGGAALVLLVVVAIFVIARFQKPDLYKKYGKSVVMLYSEFTYTLTINGKTIYFNYDETNNSISNITGNMDSAAGNPMGLYGTGFFIDAEGRIVTNRHVVHHFSPDDENNCRTMLRNEFQTAISKSSNLKDMASNKITLFTNAAFDDSRNGDSAKVAADLDSLRTNRFYQHEADSTVLVYQGFLSGMADAKFDVKIIYLGYATDGNTISSKSDYKGCHVINYSTDQAVDLAVIQSNDHKLPDGATNFIPVDQSNDQLKVGDDVTLIGYNLGAEIGVTKTGLHVQKIDGKISQEPDGNKVLYSINSLPGSSGSPVFSSSGKLVAVNFAGISQSPGYNYGILATHIKKLLNGE